MRMLLLFLIALNLVYAGWEYTRPTQTDAAVRPMPASLKSLELLEERGVTVTAELAREVEQTPEVTAQVMFDQAVLQPGIERCFTLGPFSDDAIMRQVYDSIAERVSDIRQRRVVETEAHRYWVYIPEAGGRAGAKSVAEQLKAKKIKDFYIVLKGENQNSISLGHFREQKLANRQLKKVEKLGFDVRLKVIYRDYDIFWLDYSVANEDQLDEFSVQDYQSEGVAQIQRSCDGDAG